MRTFRFFGAVCLIVVASLLLESDASPKPKIKGKNGASSSSNAKPNTEKQMPDSTRPVRRRPLIFDYKESNYEKQMPDSTRPVRRRPLIVDYKESNYGLTLQNQREVNARGTGTSDSTTPAPPKQLILYTWKNKYGLTLQNQWDANAHGTGLTLSDKLIVEDICPYKGYYSVLAKQPIPTGGIFYFEVKVIRNEGNVSIGLGTKSMPLDGWPGRYKGTYAYGGNEFWGHDVAGCFYGNTNRRPCIGGQLGFTEGDVVGCGVNLETGEIIYTKNGERLDTAGLLVSSTADLFPSVWMYGPGTKIEANFGPTFLCDEEAPGQ